MGETPLWLLGLVAAPGVLALVLLLPLWLSLRRMREAQRVLMPDGASVSVVERQSDVQRALRRLEDRVVDLDQRHDQRQEQVDATLRRAIRFQGLVRYDAYRDMGGRQSWSVALLDEAGDGTVITSLHARDHARIYMKEVREGVPLQRLSPEETVAMTEATGEPPPPAPEEPAGSGR